LILTENFPEQPVLARIIGAPFIQIISGPFDPTLPSTRGLNPIHSSEFTQLAANIWGPDLSDNYSNEAYWTRLKYYFTGWLGYWLATTRIARVQKQGLSEEYKSFVSEGPNADMILVYGAEGFINRPPLPPHVKYVYPYINGMNDESKRETLDPKMNDFLEEYKAVVLVAFGSLFNPTNDTVANIFEAFSQDE